MCLCYFRKYVAIYEYVASSSAAQAAKELGEQVLLGVVIFIGHAPDVSSLLWYLNCPVAQTCPRQHYCMEHAIHIRELNIRAPFRFVSRLLF